MAKVWLVTSGSYSEYHVCAAFSTPEAAKLYAKHCNGPDEEDAEGYVVEEYVLDAPRGTWPGAYVVTVQRDGQVERSWWSGDSEEDWTPAAVSGERFLGYGRTEEHARRSAEQLRRETLALPFLENGDG